MEKMTMEPLCESCGEKVLFEVQKEWNKKLNRYELIECGSEMCIGCLKFDTANWTKFELIHIKDIDKISNFGMSEAADYEPTTADEHNEKWVKEQQRRGNVTGDTK